MLSCYFVYFMVRWCYFDCGYSVLFIIMCLFLRQVSFLGYRKFFSFRSFCLDTKRTKKSRLHKTLLKSTNSASTDENKLATLKQFSSSTLPCILDFLRGFCEVGHNAKLLFVYFLVSGSIWIVGILFNLIIRDCFFCFL